jgi:hypothetical protein
MRQKVGTPAGPCYIETFIQPSITFASLCRIWDEVSEDCYRGFRSFSVSHRVSGRAVSHIPQGPGAFRGQAVQEEKREVMNAQRTVQARSCQYCCRGKEVLHILRVCLSIGLVIHHAKRMHRIILPSVGCSALQDVSILSHKRYYFS